MVEQIWSIDQCITALDYANDTHPTSQGLRAYHLRQLREYHRQFDKLLFTGG